MPLRISMAKLMTVCVFVAGVAVGDSNGYEHPGPVTADKDSCAGVPVCADIVSVCVH